MTFEEFARDDIRCRIFERDRVSRGDRGGLRRQQLPAYSGTARPDLLVHAALARLANGPVNTAPLVEKQEPAVSVRKSLTPDFLVCLDDGKKFKSLRRHLGTLGMTPDQYRAKWSLPSDYPMVAPNYAAARSEMAKRIGLGQMRKNAAPAKKATAAAPSKLARPAKARK